MPIRLSGLTSGLDTESIIKELMSAQSLKKTKIQNNLTKLEWKEDRWKDLNTKIYNLYRDELSKFKSQATYLTKKITSTDDSKATFSASSIVPVGTHTLDITSVASAQFVTGKKLDIYSADPTKKMNINSDTRIADITFNPVTTLTDPVSGTTTTTPSSIIAGTTLSLQLKSESSPSTYQITERTTLDDLTNWFKSKGVSFNYDAQNEQFFISSLNSGLDNSFTLTSSTDVKTDDDYNDTVLYNLGFNYLDKESDDYKDLEKELKHFYTPSEADPIAEMVAAQDELSIYGKSNQLASDAVYEQYIQDQFEKIVPDENKDKFELKWTAGEWSIEKKNEDVTESSSDYRKKLRELDKAYNKETVMNNDAKYRDLYRETYHDSYDGIKSFLASTPPETPDESIAERIGYSLNKVLGAAADSNYSALKYMGIGEITGDATKTSSTGASILDASDMVCTYNGSQYTNSSNTLTVNGLTINAIDVTTSTIKINVTNDTQGVYDTIKNFISKYNEVLKEVSDNYYAKTAKGYDVLTAEERDQMTDEQIEKWENKIKDSLLRRDDSLETVMSTLRSLSSLTSTYNGEEYNLISFNITTTDYTEKGLLHIYGNPDDAAVSDQTDKLKKAIEEDPDKVMKIFTDIGTQLYSKLGEEMASTKLSSALSFYNDREITSMKKDYNDQLTEWDKKLKDMEDRYYKKFSAMESAMSKLNSQTSYISSLFGGGNQ